MLRIKAKKSKFCICNISKKIPILPIRYNSYAIFGGVSIYDSKQAAILCKLLDGKVDCIIVDAERKLKRTRHLVREVRNAVKKSTILTFKNNDVTAEAADSLINNMFPDIHEKRISIIGAGNIGSKLALKLVERGADVYLARSNSQHSKITSHAINTIKTKFSGNAIPKRLLDIAKEADILVGFSAGIPVINKKMIYDMKSTGFILDGGVGTIQKAAIRRAIERGIKIVRLDIRSSFAASTALIFETSKFLQDIMGHKNIKGIEIVAGGYYGKYGDIVVDRVDNPRYVIGIADGRGGLLPKPYPREHLAKIRQIVQEMKLKL